MGGQGQPHSGAGEGNLGTEGGGHFHEQAPFPHQAGSGEREEGRTLSGKQGGCCRQLVSQLTPVMKETRAAGSGLKSRSWSSSWPHCMKMSERSRSGVSCSVGKRTMALDTARACGTRGVRDRLGPRAASGLALSPLPASAHQGDWETAAIDPGRPAEGQREAVLILGRQPARKGAIGGSQRGAASAGGGQGADTRWRRGPAWDQGLRPEPPTEGPPPTGRTCCCTAR